MSSGLSLAISRITDYRRKWGSPAPRDRLGYDLFRNTVRVDQSPQYDSNIQLVLNAED